MLKGYIYKIKCNHIGCFKDGFISKTVSFIQNQIWITFDLIKDNLIAVGIRYMNFILHMAVSTTVP